MGVDKLDGSKGWTPTDIGPEESAAEEGGADGGENWGEDESWEDEGEILPYTGYGSYIVGRWTGIEFNGMELPYSYSGGSFGIYLSIESDYTGELLTVQAYGDYSFYVEASGSMPTYEIVVPEIEATLDCTLTDLEIMDCAYSTEEGSMPYSLVFARD